MNEVKIDIGARLRQLRTDRNYTQEKVAELIGIKRSRYGSYEDGRAEPSIQILRSLAILYGFRSIDKMLGLEDGGALRSKVLEHYYNLDLDKRKIVDFILNLNAQDDTRRIYPEVVEEENGENAR
jgi:transcriptional regulator with XRE-family HTH domain